MRKIVILLLVFLSLSQGFSQIVPSSCNTPYLLNSIYEPDLKNLALRRLFELQSPDTATVKIPEFWIDTIREGMSAIVNAGSLPQRDSIFNLYCVHDNAPNNIFIYKEIMVFVDTSIAWTQAWQNMQTLTGNIVIDNLMTQFGYQIVQFNNFSFGSMALIHTDSLWNINAVINQLEAVQGVIFAESNAIIGTAGRIAYQKIGTTRFYNFVFEWNDCFDGCDNSRTWRYRVFEDCSVEFLGIVDWGVFGIEPLPAPINCNVFTGFPEHPDPNSGFRVYPVPATEYLHIQNPGSAIVRIQFFNVNGRLILEKNQSEIEIVNISELKNGFYQALFFTETGELKTHKLLIQR
jgi:hypothetical protein